MLLGLLGEWGHSHFKEGGLIRRPLLCGGSRSFRRVREGFGVVSTWCRGVSFRGYLGGASTTVHGPRALFFVCDPSPSHVRLRFRDGREHAREHRLDSGGLPNRRSHWSREKLCLLPCELLRGEVALIVQRLQVVQQ